MSMMQLSAVYSYERLSHLDHLNRSLFALKASGITYKLKKCKFGMAEVRYVGYVIGSGRRRADPDKIAKLQGMKIPETKKTTASSSGIL